MKSALRIGVWVILLIGLGIYGVRFAQERTLRNHYNAVVVDLMDNHRYDEAISRLEALRDKGSRSLRSNVLHSLALCHQGLAHADGLSTQARITHLKEANALDGALLSEEEKRMLKDPGSASP